MSREAMEKRDAASGYAAQSEQDVPAGYKKTEVGVIPEDWDVVRLRDLLVQPATYGIVKAGYFVNNGVPMVRGGDIKNGKVNLDLPMVTHTKSDEFSRTILRAGDILIALVGYPGETALCPMELEGANISRAVGLIRPRQEICSDFIVAYLNSPIGRRYFLKPGAGSAQLVVNLKDLNLLAIPFPPLHAQRAIATALSDVDALITALERLIAKKRAIKTAAMQQLLTGKTRLPGFSGEWETKRLGEVLTVRHGRDQKTVACKDGKYPILATGGEIGRTNACLYDKPSVLIGRKGTIDRPLYQETPFWTVDTLFYTEIDANFCPKYVYYKFLLIDWRTYNEASGVPSLNASTIENIEIVLPSLEEQTAIAQLLSDMDAEIAALETRRDKTRAIKQGMMQELLTGRVRLIKPKAEAC